MDPLKAQYGTKEVSLNYTELEKCKEFMKIPDCDTDTKFRTIDGSCNNLGLGEQASVDSVTWSHVLT